jgi:hypothetical protein
MSEKPSKAPTADDERELNEIADELYALKPDDFAAARDERVSQARADGRQALARELGKLRRPTQSAWLLNLLWRDQPDVLEQFLELGGELSRAQAEASGAELHRLTATRRGLEAALVRSARTLAEKAGVSVSAAMEREAQETLGAALARPDVAAEVRTGRLLKAASYAGFGTVIATPSVVARQPAAATKRQDPVAAESGSGTKKPEELQALVAEKRARERREEAERRVSEARSAVEAAAEALAEQERAAEAANQQQRAVQEHFEQLQEQLLALQAQLGDVRKGIVSAEREAAAAAMRRDQAQKAHAAALQTLARVEQTLADAASAS